MREHGEKLQYAYWVSFHRDMKVLWVRDVSPLCNIFTSWSITFDQARCTISATESDGILSLPLLWQGPQENVVTHVLGFILNQIYSATVPVPHLGPCVPCCQQLCVVYPVIPPWPLSRWHVRGTPRLRLGNYPRWDHFRVYVQVELFVTRPFFTSWADGTLFDSTTLRHLSSRLRTPRREVSVDAKYEVRHQTK